MYSYMCTHYVFIYVYTFSEFKKLSRKPAGVKPIHWNPADDDPSSLIVEPIKQVYSFELWVPD